MRWASVPQQPGGALCLQLRQAVLDLLAHHSQHMLICRNATFRTLPALLPCPRNIRDSLRSLFKHLNFQQQILLHHSDSLTRSRQSCGGKPCEPLQNFEFLRKPASAVRVCCLHRHPERRQGRNERFGQSCQKPSGSQRGTADARR